MDATKPPRVTKQKIYVRIFELYCEAHPHTKGRGATMDEVAAWAITKGWYPVEKSDWHWVDGKLERKA